MPGRKLGRTTMWKVARQDKDGNYKAPEVQKKVDEIVSQVLEISLLISGFEIVHAFMQIDLRLFQDKLEKEELEGKRKFEGPVDVLTTVSGTPEYSGRVRGVGGFVKPEAYFHLSKRDKLYSDDSARQRIKKMVAEENNNILAVERAQWAEKEASLVERLMRLEAMLMGKDKQIDESQKSVTLLNDLGSGQGSCSHLDKQAGVGCNEVERIKAAKKKLDLEEGKLVSDVTEKPLTVEEEVHVLGKAQVNYRHFVFIYLPKYPYRHIGNTSASLD